MRGFSLLLLTLAPVFAQGKFYDNNFNNWFVYSGDHRVHDKWGAHLELQWRRNEYVTPQQLLLRPAVNFSITPNVMLSGGFAFVSTHRYGDFPAAAPFPENRLFEQLIVNKSAKGNALQSRFRLEQRWIGVRAPEPNGEIANLGWRYQNRFRYQFRFVRDLANPWYIASYDEIFLNVVPLKGAEIFDQNRVFAGGGIRLNRFNRLETGYMLQHVLQRNGQIVELNHIWHIAIYSTLPFGD